MSKIETFKVTLKEVHDMAAAVRGFRNVFNCGLRESFFFIKERKPLMLTLDEICQLEISMGKSAEMEVEL